MWALMAPYGGAVCPTTGTITQLVTGLAHRDTFDRPNSNDIDGFWTGSDIPQSTGITSNQARTRGPYGDVQLISSSITGSYELSPSFMAQVNWNITGSPAGEQFMQFWVRNPTSGDGTNQYNETGILIEANVSLGNYITYIRSGSNIISSHSVSPATPNEIQTARIVIEDLGATGIKARFYRKVPITPIFSATSSLELAGVELSASLADSPPHTNICRMTLGAQNFWDEFMLMKGFQITVEGVPAGCYAAVTHDVGLTSSIAPSVGGTASINVENFPLPCMQVLVLADDTQTTISRFRSASVVSPFGAIWGGDEYKFEAQ